MKNIAWYVRDGHLDFLARLSQSLQAAGNPMTPFYVCHTRREEERLAAYGIRPVVLEEVLRERKKTVALSSARIKEMEEELAPIPLRRLTWSEMHEKGYTDGTILFHLSAHLEFWNDFLIKHGIEGVVSERPSILSTSVLWALCNRRRIKFIDFFTVGPDERIFLTSSWCGDIDGFDRTFRGIEVKKDSLIYTKSVKYLEKMLNRPEKPNYIFKNLVTGRETTGENLYHSFRARDLFALHRKVKGILDNAGYYNNPTIKEHTAALILHRVRSYFHKAVNIFEERPVRGGEKYFLFPLTVHREWASYPYLGLKYPHYLSVLEETAACLPFGYQLYVKEHTSGFPDKSFSTYRAIKGIRGVKLIGPRENTFELIKNSRGVITLGGSMGWEAFLMGKPVVIIGGAWYRNMPGVFKADTAEDMADLLQKIHLLPVATREEKLRAIYALYTLSFEATRYPIPELIHPDNVSKFIKPFEAWMTAGGNPEVEDALAIHRKADSADIRYPREGNGREGLALEALSPGGPRFSSYSVERG